MFKYCLMVLLAIFPGILWAEDDDAAFRRQADSYMVWDDVRYFPDGTLDASDARIVSYFLHEMEEPVLTKSAARGEEVIVRLTVIPTDGPVFVFRAEQGSEGISVSRKVGHFPIREILQVEDIDLRRVVVGQDRFGTIVKAASALDPCMFDLPAIGFDGAHWVVEIIREGRYCALREWSPRTEAWLALGEAFRAALPEEEAGVAAMMEAWRLRRPGQE